MPPSTSSGDVYEETLAVFDERPTSFEPLTTPEIADALDCERRTAYKRLDTLVDRGEIETKKVGASARVWWRNTGSSSLSSELEQVEHDLQIEEEHFRTALENSPLVVFRLDTDLRYTWIANLHEDFDPDAVLGKRDDELLPPDAAETVMEPKRRALETGERVHEEVTYELPSGQVSYDLTVVPLRDETGTIVGLTAASLDITEQKQRERHLEEYRRQCRTLIENVPSGAVALVDQDLQYVAFGGTPEGETDVTRADLEGEPVRDVLPPQIVEVVVPRYEAALDGEASAFEDTIDERVYQFHFAPVRDDQGDIFAVTAMSQDITDRKRRERELEESENRYQALVDNFPNGIVTLFDEDFHYQIAGGELYDAFDVSPRDIVGKTLYERSSPEEVELLEPAYEAAMNGESTSFETEYAGRVVEIRIVPARDEEGTVFAGTAMSQDITKRKQRERQLEEYRRWNETLVENFPAGVVALVNEDLRFLTFAGAPQGVPNTTRADFEGELVRDVLPREIADIVIPGYEAALDGEASEFEETIVGRVYHYNFVPVRDDDGRVFAVTAMSQDITEQKRREEELTALNRLNQVFQDVTLDIIESSSREEIERTITEHLTNSDSYEYAWIGHIDRHGENIVPQRAGTNEAELSEIPLSSATDDATSHSPVAEAIRTGEVQVTYDSIADPVFDQWNQSQDSHHRVGITVPITYEDRVYGVLNVYTARENAYDENERRLVERIGEVVGHAINAIERKQALLEDRVQEITFRSRRFAEVFTEAAGDESFTISIEKFVPLSDDRSIAYYALDGLDPAVFIDVIEEFNPNAEYRVTDEEESRARVEVQQSNLALASKLAKYNSWIAGGTLQNGEFRLRVHVPQHSHVREVKDVVKEAYPDVEVVAQTEIECESPRLSNVFSDLDNQLTERQRTTLEVAYFSGYFDWPRTITGGELAERLDVTPGTVSHHLRHGERKLIAAFFESTA